MRKNEPFVITISREIGSGGHTVGKILAEKLGTRYCDKDLIKSLTKKFNLTVDEIEKLKGEKKNWLSEFIQLINPAPSPSRFGVETEILREFKDEIPTSEIYKAETEILKALAAEGSCVIAGRSGFHVFKDHPNSIHVFISASDENRVRRVMQKQNLDEKSALALIRKIDKARENYIQRFAGVSRYDSRNYDLVICSDDHTEDQIADLIISYICDKQ